MVLECALRNRPGSGSGACDGHQPFVWVALIALTGAITCPSQVRLEGQGSGSLRGDMLASLASPQRHHGLKQESRWMLTLCYNRPVSDFCLELKMKWWNSISLIILADKLVSEGQADCSVSGGVAQYKFKICPSIANWFCRWSLVGLDGLYIQNVGLKLILGNPVSTV